MLHISATNMQLDLELGTFSFYISVILGFLLLTYIFWDVNYFIRVLFTIGYGRLFQKKTKMSGTTSIYGIVTTQDLDIIFKHMNNARFVRELDFARFHFYDQTGLYKIITKNKAHALQTACSIRYRRTIPLFTPYKVTTKCLYWDDKTMYLEQQFVTLSDGFIRATVLSKQHVIGLNVTEVMGKLEPDLKPSLPEELDLWINSMEASSKKLRKSD